MVDVIVVDDVAVVVVVDDVAVVVVVDDVVADVVVSISISFYLPLNYSVRVKDLIFMVFSHSFNIKLKYPTFSPLLVNF